MPMPQQSPRERVENEVKRKTRGAARQRVSIQNRHVGLIERAVAIDVWIANASKQIYVSQFKGQQRCSFEIILLRQCNSAFTTFASSRRTASPSQPPFRPAMSPCPSRHDFPASIGSNAATSPPIALSASPAQVRFSKANPKTLPILEHKQHK